MKFIRDLLSRKSSTSPAKSVEPLDELVGQRKPRTPEIAPLPASQEMAEPSAKLDIVGQAPEAQAEATRQHSAAIDNAADNILQKINAQVADEEPLNRAAAPVNIWDMEGEDAAEAPAAEAAPAPRRRRNKTRLLGFDAAAPEGDVVSMFDKAEKVAPAARAKFPVGWLIVSDGPGRGECFSLENGMSQIGRGDDQAVQLDFGDNTISRTNHAALVYDPTTHEFMLGHGGKQNIVRLNGTPVISNEAVSTGDEIKIGETTLRFVALCTEEFNWTDTDTGSEESEDVAIA